MSAVMPRPDALYAADEGLVAPLSAQECLVQNPRTQDRHVMTFEVFQALDACKHFATMDQHLRGVLDAMPALRGQEDAAKRVLGGFVDRGLLQSADQISAELAAAPARRKVGLGPIFVLAEDRPEGLARALDSMIRSGDTGLDRLPIVVLDGSRSQQSREANRRVVDERRRDAGLKYLGNTERAAFIARLQGQIKPHASALTYLLGEDEAPTRAQLFNWMLLLGAGHRVIVFDDRQFLPQREMPGAEGGIDLLHNHARSAYFISSDEPNPAPEVGTDDGYLSVQADRYVGESIGRVVSLPGRLQMASASLAGASLPSIRQFEPSGRVTALIQGTIGSIEAPHNTWLYQLDNASRNRFWAARETYLRWYEGDQVCHGIARARMTLAGVYQPSALDLQALGGFVLPGAGARIGPSFGVLTKFLDPESAVLHSTTANGHQWQPSLKRSDAARKPFTPAIANFLSDHIQARTGEARAAGSLQRAAALAALLDDLASSPSSALQAELGSYLTYKRSELVADLQRRIDEAGKQAPIYWEADLREIVQATGKELVRSSVPRLADCPESLDAAGCAERVRGEVRQLAAAMRAWPAAFEAAPGVAQAWVG